MRRCGDVVTCGFTTTIILFAYYRGDVVTKTEHPTVSMSADMLERIESELEYGDTRAEWIREAVRQRLNQDQDATE